MKCPLRIVTESQPTRVSVEHGSIRPIGYKANAMFCDCLRNMCAWWISDNEMRNTEGNWEEGRCALKAIAMKNAEGKLPC